MAALVVLNQRTGRVAMAVFVQFNFELLLRTRSEGCKVWLGDLACIDCLPDGWMNAVVLTGSTLKFVIGRRKNRPKGSVLNRSCSCKPLFPVKCVVCNIQEACKHLVKGDLLWDFAPAPTLKLLRSQLGAWGIKAGQKDFTWKSFRGGKATEMAARGSSLGTILLAGEWKTAAFARYVSVELVDPGKILDDALNDSDDE